jgi:hypothetical protein
MSRLAPEIPQDETAMRLAPVRSLRPARPSESAPFPLDPVLIGAGVRIAGKSIVRRAFGWKRHQGTAQEICRAVVDRCWNGRYFAGSAGHFSQFWTRDLAMCTPALCRLGLGDKVRASWAWGLERFARGGRITTTIFGNRPRDVYAFGCDSLPLLLHALREGDAWHLVQQHRDFLAHEVQRYLNIVFDPDADLARASGYFSGPRDCVTGRSTVFANTMLLLLQRLLEESEGLLPNPLKGHDVRGQVLSQHWTGRYFRDSLCRAIPSGDANVYPYFFGAFSDAGMRRQSLATLEERGFTRPIPLRYFERRDPSSELPVPRFFTPNYQGDPSWMQLCPAYLQVLRADDAAAMVRERDRVAALIERDGSYLELYTTEGQPYRGRGWLYFADEAMIWASMFLDLY